MHVQDAVAPRDLLQRKGQGQLQDAERPLLLCVTRGAILKVERTDRRSNMTWRITAPPDSHGAVTFALPVTDRGRRSHWPRKPRMG